MIGMLEEMLFLKKLLKAIFYFLVLNLGICNQIWTGPVNYWWMILLGTGAMSLFFAFD
jgi:hypothetical protein